MEFAAPFEIREAPGERQRIAFRGLDNSSRAKIKGSSDERETAPCHRSAAGTQLSDSWSHDPPIVGKATVRPTIVGLSPTAAWEDAGADDNGS